MTLKVKYMVAPLTVPEITFPFIWRGSEYTYLRLRSPSHLDRAVDLILQGGKGHPGAKTVGDIVAADAFTDADAWNHRTPPREAFTLSND